MRIAHVSPTYPPYRGGVGLLAAEYATRLRARGHDVHVFTPAFGRASADADFVHRLGAPLRVGNAAFTPALLTQLRGFDLVHLHYPFFGGAEPVLLGKWLHSSQPLVVSYHMDAVAGGVRGALFRLHARLVLPRIVACADRVLVSSADYAAHSALAGIGDALARVEVHPYGVDTERFHSGRDLGLRDRLGVAHDETVAIFVSRLDLAHHFKGLSVVLDALAGPHAPGCRLVVVGDGPLRDGFMNRAASLGIAGRVHFVGDVSDADLPTYYRAADIHVCPSTEAAEAFSLVSLEAAASGIPTIASSLPGVRTVVVDGETGLLVPPNNALCLRETLDALTERPERAAALGRAARARAEAHYGWEPAITRLEATYQGVLAGAG
jgi:glycosyltransferase involved in cell wall biosynthesis